MSIQEQHRNTQNKTEICGYQYFNINNFLREMYRTPYHPFNWTQQLVLSFKGNGNLHNRRFSERFNIHTMTRAPRPIFL